MRAEGIGVLVMRVKIGETIRLVDRTSDTVIAEVRVQRITRSGARIGLQAERSVEFRREAGEGVRDQATGIRQ